MHVPVLDFSLTWVIYYFLTRTFVSRIQIVSQIFFSYSMLQVGGDLEDLEQALGKKDAKRVRGSGSCSALIKLLPGNKDLYVSHDTWNTYQSMLRVLKKYNFPYQMKQGGDFQKYVPSLLPPFTPPPDKRLQTPPTMMIHILLYHFQRIRGLFGSSVSSFNIVCSS